MSVTLCQRIAKDSVYSMPVHKGCTPEQFDEKWKQTHGTRALSVACNGGLHALLLAANFGNVALVRHLSQRDLSLLDLGDITGTTPLIASVHRDYLVVAETLIEMGADINMAALNGENGLGIAAKIRKVAMVKLFVKFNAIPAPMPDAEGQLIINQAKNVLKEERVALLLAMNFTSEVFPSDLLQMIIEYV